MRNMIQLARISIAFKHWVTAGDPSYLSQPWRYQHADLLSWMY